MNVLMILTVLLFVSTYSELLAANNILPIAVIQAIEQEEEDCHFEDSNNKQRSLQTNTDKIVKRADLNADGITDFMFLDSDIYCEMGASFRNGNGGVGVMIFVGTKDKNAKLAFEKTVFDAKIEKGKSHDTAWITVGRGLRTENF